ncbi:hypothetical protein [uncultured Flavobacterium sp.]|uniref:hypothetical protein n=1 Tax=uncultured Flavobacterium sp. TaxID=165435 RepID=UPI0030EEB9BA|tara:strand:- start:810 stop:1016 length:207 start_codon:yes stop_codon:yes gene_type:complete
MARLIIRPKDIEIILNVSPSYARRIVRVIKKAYGKEKHQKITINEFCRYMGLDVKDVKDELNEFYNKK